MAVEFDKELDEQQQVHKDTTNRFESVIQLYEAGCADYIFNFVIDSNKREEKLVTPILMDLVDDNNRTTGGKVLGIHIFKVH